MGGRWAVCVEWVVGEVGGVCGVGGRGGGRCVWSGW